MLRKRGIDRVRPLAGGFDAWLAAGLPVEPIEADGTNEPAVPTDEARSEALSGTHGAST